MTAPPTHITGKIHYADGSESEFSLHVDLGWQQWGGRGDVLGQNVDMLQAMAEATDGTLIDDSELCAEDGCYARLDDGEGYDGLCGDHADQAEKEAQRFRVKKDGVASLWGIWDNQEDTWLDDITLDDTDPQPSANHAGVPSWDAEWKASSIADQLNDQED